MRSVAHAQLEELLDEQVEHAPPAQVEPLASRADERFRAVANPRATVAVLCVHDVRVREIVEEARALKGTRKR